MGCDAGSVCTAASDMQLIALSRACELVQVSAACCFAMLQVCDIVLGDKTVNRDTRRRRAEALRDLSNIFQVSCCPSGAQCVTDSHCPCTTAAARKSVRNSGLSPWSAAERQAEGLERPECARRQRRVCKEGRRLVRLCTGAAGTLGWAHGANSIGNVWRLGRHCGNDLKLPCLLQAGGAAQRAGQQAAGGVQQAGQQASAGAKQAGSQAASAAQQAGGSAQQAAGSAGVPRCSSTCVSRFPCLMLT